MGYSMKKKQNKDYHITPIRLMPEAKKRVRILAAEKDTTMADMAGELLSLGMAAYEESLKTEKRASGKPVA
jgi:hypothetical protein